MTPTNHYSIRAFFLSGICCLLSASTGCTMFNSNLKQADIDQAANQPAVPIYKVRMYGKGKPSEFVGKLDKNKTVQTALEESGAIDKFARMEITLARETPAVGRYKMPVTFDSSARMVTVSQDYAIHPNDVLVIRKDTSNFLDRTIDKMGGLGVR